MFVSLKKLLGDGKWKSCREPLADEDGIIRMSFGSPFP